jgi:hypothetical protein
MIDGKEPMQDVFRSISALFRDADAGDEARQAVLFAAWKRSAGEQLCEHTAPLKFEQKRLTVAVSGVRWKQQLEDLAGQMVFRLNAAFGTPVLNYIEFVVDEAAVERSVAKAHASANDPDKYSGELPRDVIEAAAAIRDPKLRTDFLAAAASCVERPAKLG